MSDAVVNKVIVELTARLGQYNADVRSSKALFDRSVGGMAQTAENAERRIRASSAGIKTALLGATSALAAGFTAKSVTDLADSYTRFTNQLKIAGLEGSALSGVQEDLFRSAQKYGVELESLGVLYGRVAQAGKELGATQEDLLKFTDGVAAAIKVQGSSTEAAKGALLQLSQALGGAVVRAEEYNSINEGARPILQAVADGSDRFKGSVNALRNAVIDGKVSSQEFYQAFLKGSDQLEAKAGKANLTIAVSLQTLNNALGVYVGQTDASLSATQRISAAIEALANNLDTIVPALTVLVGLIGVRYVGSMVAATVATVGKARADLLAAQNAAAYTVALNAQAAANARLTALTLPATAALNYQAATSLSAATAARGLGSGLLALAGGPIGVTVLAVAALAAGMVYLNSKYSEAAILQRELGNSATATGNALDEYEKAARNAANATAENASQAIANANAMRIEAQEAVRAAMALRERTAALANQRAAEAREADRQASGGGVGTPYPGLLAGQSIRADRRAADAEQAALKAVEQEQAALERLAAIQQGLADGSYRNAPTIAPVAAKTPKGRQGKSAEEIENERLRIERRFADDLRDANRQVLDARAAQARAESDILANDIRRIRQSRDDAIAEAEERGPKGSKEYTQARVDQLTALYRATAGIDEQTAIQASANRVLAGWLQVQESRFENQRDGLTADRDLAQTSAARAELDRQLLALAQQQERAQLEGVLASQESSEAEQQIARERLAFLPRLQAAQAEALRRQNLTPLERLGETERRNQTNDPQQRREIVENIAASELDGLASSLARASLEAEGFGDALLQTGKSVVEGVLAEVYQSIIVAPLADLMRQGLDSLFGTAATSAKTNADAQAAISSTALSTSATAASTSLATLTTAAAVLQQAMLQAAAAAASQSGSDLISTIGSAIGSGGARAIGGNVSQNLPVLVGENRPEVFWPSGSGVISPYMPQVETRSTRPAAGGNVQIVNNTGVPAVPVVERDDQTGDQKITLEPIGNQMIEGAGRSGKLKRALMKSPQPKKRA